MEELKQRRRRERLHRLFAEYGSQAKFIAATEENQGAISAIANGKRVFGDRKARSLEKKLGKPQGWFDGDASPVICSFPETYMDRLTPDEMRLMNAYRSADALGKIRILDAAEAVSSDSSDAADMESSA